VKIRQLLRWSSSESNISKSETLKNVRRRTDEMLRKQSAEEEERAATEDKRG
jgi:hypothetical protein